MHGSYAVQEYLGLNLEKYAPPDETTILRFRHLMKASVGNAAVGDGQPILFIARDQGAGMDDCGRPSDPRSDLDEEQRVAP